MENRSINIRVVMDRLLRHPMMQDINFEAVVDYTVDFMRLVGVPAMFTEKTACLDVKDHRAELPCDWYAMNQVRLCREGNPVFRYSGDTFHMSPRKGATDGDLTYKVQGGFIFTSLRDGTVEISYQAIETDEEGFPVLPDNSSFLRALELYVKKQWFTILFDMGRISQASLQNVQQEYAWAAGDCASEFNRLDLDKAESFYNSWRTLVMREDSHRTGFARDGMKERIKLQ